MMIAAAFVSGLQLELAGNREEHVEIAKVLEVDFLQAGSVAMMELAARKPPPRWPCSRWPRLAVFYRIWGYVRSTGTCCVTVTRAVTVTQRELEVDSELLCFTLLSLHLLHSRVTPR
jgi:hypothetical protein